MIGSHTETALDMRLHHARLVQQRIEKDRADKLAAYDAMRRGEAVPAVKPQQVKA